MSEFGFNDPQVMAAILRTYRDNQQQDAQTANLSAESQIRQASLADMLYNQQRQRSLASLVSQNAGVYQDPIARSMAQAGFGDEATQQQERADRIGQIHRTIVQSQAATIKTPEEAEKLVQRYGGLYFNGDEKGHDALSAVQNFAAAAVPVQQQPTYQEALRRQAALADPNSPTSAIRTGLVGQFGGPALPAGTPGNAVDDKELDELEKAQAAKLRNETARMMMGLGAGTGAVDMDNVPGWVKTAALTYHNEGKLPAFKDPGGYLHKQIMQVADAMFPGDNVSANAATFKANMADLEEGQKLAGATDVNEAKALGDIQVFRNSMKGVFDSNSPWLNATARKLQENAGNPQVAAFLTARQALANQVTKVLSAGNLSDSARKEAEDLIQAGGSMNQLNAVLGVLEQDMSRSKAAMHQRVSNAKARISGKAASGEDAGASGPDHDAAAEWLRDPKNKSSPYYARALSVYKAAHGGAEP